MINFQKNAAISYAVTLALALSSFQFFGSGEGSGDYVYTDPPMTPDKKGAEPVVTDASGTPEGGGGVAVSPRHHTNPLVGFLSVRIICINLPVFFLQF